MRSSFLIDTTAHCMVTTEMHQRGQRHVGLGQRDDQVGRQPAADRGQVGGPLGQVDADQPDEQHGDAGDGEGGADEQHPGALERRRRHRAGPGVGRGVAVAWSVVVTVAAIRQHPPGRRCRAAARPSSTRASSPKLPAAAARRWPTRATGPRPRRRRRGSPSPLAPMIRATTTSSTAISSTAAPKAERPLRNLPESARRVGLEREAEDHERQAGDQGADQADERGQLGQPVVGEAAEDLGRPVDERTEAGEGGGRRRPAGRGRWRRAGWPGCSRATGCCAARAAG